ncbi:unnamed protein product [Peronospora belbahrii]|uniref:CCT domain-containing protein n=1 Tax=Peronospora belbahrii TaxID=622444 RepID=A0ABN8CKY6_9STRA|nr:unnamed protein product [Peronospora belbahrii]
MTSVVHGFTTPRSEDLDVHAASPTLTSSLLQLKKSKFKNEMSSTRVNNPLHDMRSSRQDCITAPVKMIGAYTPAARCMLLQKYMAKRARRLSQHKLRYGVRKALATARPRVNGRFVKTVQPLMAAVAVSHQVQH